MAVTQVLCKTMLNYICLRTFLYVTVPIEFYFFKEPAHLHTTQDSIS